MSAVLTERGEVLDPAERSRAQGPPQFEPPPQVEVRRRLGGGRPSDRYALIGAFAAAISLSTLIYFVIAPWSGLLGYIVISWLLFVGIYALLVSMEGNRVLVVDRLAAVVIQSGAALLIAVLVLVVGFTLFNGRAALSQWRNFFTEDMILAGPLEPLDVGGIAHGIVGTLIMISIVLVFIVPLGIVCAVFLSERRGAFPRLVRAIVEAMTALPSIVAGLFVLSVSLTLISLFGFGQRSGFAAAIALSVMALPIVIRTADVVLRLVPGTLKEAAAATGASQWRILWYVTLPTARPGLLTAVILGTARAIGETSPVLLTSGITNNINVNPFSGSMVSLPLLTFDLTKSPSENYISRGFGAAAVLMVIVLILFAFARYLGGRPAGELSRAQVRRRARQSARDLERIRANNSAARPGGSTTRPDAAPVGFTEGAADT